MAKPNIHSAGREELVEAGVRAELADEILKLRRKGRIESADALAELPGVGPATVEQLKKALDFREPEGNGQGREAQTGGGREAQAGGERREEGGAARGAEAVAQTATRATAETARRGAEITATVVADAGRAQRAVAQQAGEGAAEISRALIDLVTEQSQHNLQVLGAFGRVMHWEDFLRLQGEYLQASLDRLARFNHSYLELARRVMAAQQAGEPRERGRRAA